MDYDDDKEMGDGAVDLDEALLEEEVSKDEDEDKLGGDDEKESKDWE